VQALRSSGIQRALPVNPNPLSFEPKAREEKSAKRVRAAAREGPANSYHPFVTLHQAGQVVVASDNSDSLVVIKKTKVNSKDGNLPGVRTLFHENIVNLIDIFREDYNICFVYEKMDVSLRDVNTVVLARGRWKSFEIGGICKEVGCESLNRSLQFAC